MFSISTVDLILQAQSESSRCHSTTTSISWVAQSTMSRARNTSTSNTMPFLSGPLAAGGIVASGMLLLPPRLMSEVTGRLPDWLVRSRALVPAKVRGPLAVVPGRVYLVLAGFTIGYLGRKYVIWLRLWLVRQLLKNQEWMQKVTWKTKVSNYGAK